MRRRIKRADREIAAPEVQVSFFVGLVCMSREGRQGRSDGAVWGLGVCEREDSLA